MASPSDQATQLVADLKAKFPRTDQGPLDLNAVDTIYKAALALVGKVSGEASSAISNLSNTFVTEQIYNFGNALLNASKAYTSKYGNPIRNAKKAGAKTITLSDFRSDTIGVALQAQSSAEGIALLESMKPWYLRVWGASEVLSALSTMGQASLYIRAIPGKVYDAAQAAIPRFPQIPWGLVIGGTIVGLWGWKALGRKGRR